MTIEKQQHDRFIQKLSIILMIVSSLGAILVLVDPVVTFVNAAGTSITVGGNGFADQMKGAVVTLILVGGFTAVKEYWLGSSAGSDKKSEVISDIAKDSPTFATAVKIAAQAQGVAPAPLVTDEINVSATTANVVETGVSNAKRSKK